MWGRISPTGFTLSDGSVNATTWTSLTNITLPSSPYLFIDTNSTSAPSRFYRAQQQ